MTLGHYVDFVYSVMAVLCLALLRVSMSLEGLRRCVVVCVRCMVCIVLVAVVRPCESIHIENMGLL